MATRKQRARRAKAMRHEYSFVTYDEEGNEVEVDPAELRAQKKEKEKEKEKGSTSKERGATSQQAGGRRRAGDPQPPSWNRALRRGGIWGAATIAASVFLLRGTSVPVRVAIGAVYAALFIPMTYWIDGVVYRRFERRRTSGGRSGPGRQR